MTSRKLEITEISAEALMDGKKTVKNHTYITFEISKNNTNRTMQTSVEDVGGNYPTWKDKLETEIILSEQEKKSDNSFMYVRVYCVGKSKHVGTARVAIKDFTGEYAPYGFLHCLSYRLWDDFGRRNGIVNFSARIVTHGGGSNGVITQFWLRS